MVDMVDILNTLRVNHVAYGATYARWGVTNRATQVAASDGGGPALGARSEGRQVMARAAAQARRMLKAR
jgi:hypothetical protein